MFTKGKRVNAQLMQLRYIPRRDSDSGDRFALLIGKKCYRTAVERNRLRRQLYEAIRLNWNFLARPCYDVVVLLHPQVKEATYQDMERDIIFCMNKIR